MDFWVSPDGKIKKEVIKHGRLGWRPMEGTQCTVTITDSPLLEEFTNSVVTIGDTDGDLWRTLDKCLMTMLVGEKSKFTLDLLDSSITLNLELLDMLFDGFIYEWSAEKKYTLALLHKEKGNKFFQEKNNKEAAYRFSKGLKLLASIPIDVEDNPIVVDGIKLEEINKLKLNLYNNLSSCYFRNNRWEMVIELCKKVFSFDPNNLKALYKIGVAYQGDRNFEKAFEYFKKVMELDPGNKACAEQLEIVKSELKTEEIKCKNMIKKMFTAVVDK